MQRQWRRQRTATWAVAGCAALLLGAAVPTRTPGPAAAPALGIRPHPGRPYTLLDSSLALPPLEMLAPDLTLADRELGTQAPPAVAPPSAVQWKFGYRHAQLADLSSRALRNDPSTGFSRQLDTDVLALGMSWTLAGSQVGLAYQLQSARGGVGDDTGFARFLPGSEAATHALTLGVRHEFGADLPPPAPPPLLILDDVPTPTPDAPPASPPPTP